MNTRLYQRVPENLREVAEARDKVKLCEAAVEQAQGELKDRKRERDDAQAELNQRIDEALGIADGPGLFDSLPEGTTAEFQFHGGKRDGEEKDDSA